MKIHRPAAVLILACVFLAQVALGQGTSSPQSRLGEIDAQIRRGEWSLARDAALSLIETARTSLLASDLAGAVAPLNPPA